jgi:hypothetical protein
MLDITADPELTLAQETQLGAWWVTVWHAPEPSQVQLEPIQSAH